MKFFMFQLVSILFIISVVFLTTLAVYDIFNASKKLFGAMRLCTISMLIIFYVVLIQIKLSGEGYIVQWPIICLVEGLIIQFCYLSAMCWLNAMSFVIWNNFRSMKARRPRLVYQERPLSGFKDPAFKWYACYAWGIPLIIFIVTLSMQLLPEDQVANGVIVPEIGASRCFLQDYWATLVYFHVVSIPVLVGNVFFFIFFTYNLMCGLWANKSGDPVLRARNTAHFKTVVKMFFALGLTWTCEFVSWILEWGYGKTNPASFRFSSIFKVLNALQGFIMFCVIVCNSSTVKRIKTCGQREQLGSVQPSPITRTTNLRSVDRRSSILKIFQRKKSNVIRPRLDPEENIELGTTKNNEADIDQA